MRAARCGLRAVCHLVAEVPLFVIAGLQISKGWLPTSDDAVIAWRSYNVFSARIPLDGQFTQLSAGGHAAFDLGPLQYFLLAVPERIDPLHGILWGSALVIAILAGLAIEAVWSCAGPLGAALTSLGIAIMTATLIESTVNLAWNPSTGVYSFVATMAASLAVASGRFNWLPVAIGTGSLAVQCHIMFAMPVAAALLVALLLGVAQARPASFRSFAVAVAVGAAAFMAPLVQQLSGHPGNWTALAENLSHEGPKLGIDTGLRGITAAAGLPPSWWVHVPAANTLARYQHLENTLYGHSATWGIVSLALCAAIAVLAWKARHRTLAALAAISAAAGDATAWTLGSVSVPQAGYLIYYLYFGLWPIGMSILTTFGVAIWCAARFAAHRVRTRSMPAHSSPSPAESSQSSQPSNGAPWLTALAALCLALAGTGLGVVAEPLGSSPLFLLGWSPVQTAGQAVPIATRAIVAHRQSHQEPFTVQVIGGFPFMTETLDVSIAYLLAMRGYAARVPPSADTALGPSYLAPAHSPVLELKIGPKGALIASWRSGRRR
ncbi:MAG: hypothetical protein ACYDBS_06195 [Acidimicrobiales bacterium]